MARKTILVCDKCAKEVDEGKGRVMRLYFTDARVARNRPISATVRGRDARATRSLAAAGDRSP